MTDSPNGANAATQNYKVGARSVAQVQGWGMAITTHAYQFFPTETGHVQQLMELAKKEGRPICPRGGGNSYGDAAALDDAIVIDFSKMNRILSWDPETGIIDCQPGVTIENIWRSVISDGYWLPVVSGTMKTTMGGCAAMNIHGKNNYCMGPFGEHIQEFDIILPDGSFQTCSPDQNDELYYSCIGGFGMLGIITRVRLKLKKVHSGMLRVEALNTRSIAHMIEEIEQRHTTADYLVGWVDCFPGGKKLGRGVIHHADYLPEGADKKPEDNLNVKAQDLPDNIMGVIPKRLTWQLLRPFNNNFGMRAINAAKFISGQIMPQGHVYYQSHAAFAFLLDYVPNWKFAYKPGGLIQYQSFIPKENASNAFNQLLKLNRKRGMPSYLGVLKKHRPDPFLMTHALDGYSLALDFKVTEFNREKVWAMADAMNEIVLTNGGRFYFAKDLTLTPEVVRQAFPEENYNKFVELKKKYDPDHILQTGLSRRLFNEPFYGVE